MMLLQLLLLSSLFFLLAVTPQTPLRYFVDAVSSQKAEQNGHKRIFGEFKALKPAGKRVW